MCLSCLDTRRDSNSRKHFISLLASFSQYYSFSCTIMIYLPRRLKSTEPLPPTGCRSSSSHQQTASMSILQYHSLQNLMGTWTCPVRLSDTTSAPTGRRADHFRDVLFKPTVSLFLFFHANCSTPRS